MQIHENEIKDTHITGVDSLPPKNTWHPSAKKLRDTYAITPEAPLFQREFGYYCLEAWHQQGLPKDADLAALFHYDPPGNHYLFGLGGCEAAFDPEFTIEVIEDRGAYEVERDFAGRHVLYFKGRRDGFMPEYIDHPVKDWKTWEEDVKWRMNPETPSRYQDLEERMVSARQQAGQGLIIGQYVVGGYMYLRSLMGPEGVLYMVCEDPTLVHACMAAWFELADGVIARHQEYVTLDELLLDEDICFNHGPLISPDMMRAFLFPYYQQLISNIKSRQRDRNRHLYFHLATDGNLETVIPVYQELGMDAMQPFEVASGNDVVAIGRQHPGLVISGGIDKRILAAGKDAIDRHVEAILPAMRARGGYIPTCDHGVPEEVPLEEYLHYRNRCVELGG